MERLFHLECEQKKQSIVIQGLESERKIRRTRETHLYHLVKDDTENDSDVAFVLRVKIDFVSFVLIQYFSIITSSAIFIINYAS